MTDRELIEKLKSIAEAEPQYADVLNEAVRGIKQNTNPECMEGKE